MNNLRILVTGGAGFIGSNIVESLLNNNVKYVRILDNLKTGKMNNIQFLLDKYKNVEFMYGDISNLEDCKKAVCDIDIITHQAALGSVPRSINDPLSSHINNVNGFFNILLAAKENGIKRIVYASSSSVYGDNITLPKIENSTGNVLSPYAATKAIDEIYAGVFTKCYGMECIGLRYFNVFGPRQDPNGAYAAVIPKFINMIKNGIQPIINGDGSFSRDFTYVDNVVEANVLALTTDNEDCYGQVFNIGIGRQVSILKLFNTINNILNINIVPIFGEERNGDIPHSNADISKAIEMLKYEPKISFEEGIDKYIFLNKFKKNNYINIDEINYNELLNKKSINVNLEESLIYLHNKKILITGGAGSIGSEIVKQLLYLGINNLYIIDNSECNIYILREILQKIFPNNTVKFLIGDITDKTRIKKLFEEIYPNIIFHSAAYKHVSLMEENIYESIKVNIIGTKIIADFANEYNTEKFLFISTDKAVNPSNIMGTCKRVSELYINYLNNNNNIKTEYIITRFGNVLGSSGSVIPTFIQNINNNVNLQITHKDVTRFFMSIPEAAKLVIKSITYGNKGEILLFNMGEPIKILDLATRLLDLYTYKDTKLSYDIIGLRPGEKLNEELSYENEEFNYILETNIIKLKNKNILSIYNYNKLINDYLKMNNNELKQLLHIIIPEYKEL